MLLKLSWNPTYRFFWKPYIVKQTGSVNTQTYQLQHTVSIEHQILVTNLQGNV